MRGGSGGSKRWNVRRRAPAPGGRPAAVIHEDRHARKLLLGYQPLHPPHHQVPGQPHRHVAHHHLDRGQRRAMRRSGGCRDQAFVFGALPKSGGMKPGSGSPRKPHGSARRRSRGAAFAGVAFASLHADAGCAILRRHCSPGLGWVACSLCTAGQPSCSACRDRPVVDTGIGRPCA